jgi:hypothetical protein
MDRLHSNLEFLNYGQSFSLVWTNALAYNYKSEMFIAQTHGPLSIVIAIIFGLLSQKYLWST